MENTSGYPWMPAESSPLNFFYKFHSGIASLYKDKYLALTPNSKTHFGLHNTLITLSILEIRHPRRVMPLLGSLLE